MREDDPLGLTWLPMWFRTRHASTSLRGEKAQLCTPVAEFDLFDSANNAAAMLTTLWFESQT